MKFGPEVKPPEWVFSLGRKAQQPENVGREIVKCVGRVDELKQELDKELFLLSWLRKLKDSSGGEADFVSASQLGHVPEEDFFVSRSKKKATNSQRAGEVAQVGLTGEVETSKDHNLEAALGFSPTSRSQDSPSSSEYYTAGPSSNTTSPSYFTEEEPSPVSIRKRLVQNVTPKDIQVAKIVRHQIREGRHWSCLDLNQITLKGEELVLNPSLTGKHRRFHSAPALEPEWLSHHRSSSKYKKRLWSIPCGAVVRDGSVARGGPIEHSLFSLPQPLGTNYPTATTEQKNWRSPNQVNLGLDSITLQSSAEVLYVRRVVLRDKSKVSKSLSMDSEEELGQWKGSGMSSPFAGKRSSNGIQDSVDSYKFITKHSENEEDNDPALSNVMASHIRGTLRSQRTSIDQPPLSPDSTSGARVTSPSLEVRHIPISGSGSDAVAPLSDEGGNSKHAPLFLRRKNTDSSSVKRDRFSDRFSYHYSDDECTTPKVDMGDPMAFAANTPQGSRGCSHRNSRSSNGILDEETTTVHELTLRRSHEPAVGDNHINTVTASDGGGVDHEKRRSMENGGSLLYRKDGDDEESSLTMTLTDHSPSRKKSTDVFYETSTSTLGGLDLDIESTLSKFRDAPEMSMAGLLDVKENRQMNATRTSYKGYLDSTPEDSEYLESIEIDDATISAFTLSNNLYGSRYNSASSLPGLFSDASGTSSSSPTEQESPTHSSSSTAAAASAALQGVNLRQTGGRRLKDRKRMCNADLEAFSVEGGGECGFEISPSMSSASLTSEEESSVSTSPQREGNLLVRLITLSVMCLH